MGRRAGRISDAMGAKDGWDARLLRRLLRGRGQGAIALAAAVLVAAFWGAVLWLAGRLLGLL